MSVGKVSITFGGVTHESAGAVPMRVGPPPIRVLVCGGRGYADRPRVFAVLDALHAVYEIASITHGGASGADTLAGEWCALRGIPEACYPADWAQHGRKAGPIRNQQMLEASRPDLVVAFPGGKGTADMCHRAELAGVEVGRVV